jgi:hypothetical protein
VIFLRRAKKKTTPFILLVVVHVSLLIITFYKNPNRKSLFILLLTNIGFAYGLEFFILNLFHSYQYKPKLFRDKYLNNVFGAFLSQGVFLPFTAIFITAHGLGWKVKGLFAFYFFIVERIFIRLKVFKNNWWRTTYTIILVPIYFAISDQWYHHLFKGNRVIKIISHFLMTWVTGGSFINIFTSLRKIKIGVGRHSSWKEHFVTSTLYWLILSLFLTWSSMKLPNKVSQWISFLFMKLLDWIIDQTGLVKFSLISNPYYTFFQLVMIYLTTVYKKWIFQVHYVKNEKP